MFRVAGAVFVLTAFFTVWRKFFWQNSRRTSALKEMN